jgi:hypothetical protein
VGNETQGELLLELLAQWGGLGVDSLFVHSDSALGSTLSAPTFKQNRAQVSAVCIKELKQSSVEWEITRRGERERGGVGGQFYRVPTTLLPVW